MARGRISGFGSYRGVPAIGYEVLDDSGRVAAADYVILQPLPGESWEDLAAFVLDVFLPPRLARYELGLQRFGTAIAVPGRAPQLRGEQPPARLLGRSAEVSRAQAMVWQAARQTRPVTQKPAGSTPERRLDMEDEHAG